MCAHFDNKSDYWNQNQNSRQFEIFYDSNRFGF